jgi:hypothetical protein
MRCQGKRCDRRHRNVIRRASAASATGTASGRPPWHATQQAVWETLHRAQEGTTPW